jgi:hypothetical protein
VAVEEVHFGFDHASRTKRPKLAVETRPRKRGAGAASAAASKLATVRGETASFGPTMSPPNGCGSSKGSLSPPLPVHRRTSGHPDPESSSSNVHPLAGTERWCWGDGGGGVSHDDLTTERLQELLWSLPHRGQLHPGAPYLPLRPTAVGAGACHDSFRRLHDHGSATRAFLSAKFKPNFVDLLPPEVLNSIFRAGAAAAATARASSWRFLPQGHGGGCIPGHDFARGPDGRMGPSPASPSRPWQGRGEAMAAASMSSSSAAAAGEAAHERPADGDLGRLSAGAGDGSTISAPSMDSDQDDVASSLLLLARTLAAPIVSKCVGVEGSHSTKFSTYDL